MRALSVPILAMSLAPSLAVSLAVLLVMTMSPAALAGDDIEISIGGRVQTDLRFRVQEKSIGGWWTRQALPVGLSRNENIFKFKFEAEYGSFRGVADIDFVLYGRQDELESFGMLSRREKLDPYRFDAHSVYLEAGDLFFEGLDLRIGQQLVQWGVADQFNPTNNLNSDDLEDPLLFGEQQGNLMVKLDYTFLEEFTVSGVLVPLFRPALVPTSAALGLGAIDRLPFGEPELRWLVQSQNVQAIDQFRYPVVVARAKPELPEITPENMQFAFRFAGVLGEQDISVSYYNGRSDFPVPYLNYNRLETFDSPRCKLGAPAPYPDDAFDLADPARRGAVDRDGNGKADAEECIKGFIATDTYLRYPKMQVLGFNMAGEIPGVGIGYRFELGVFFPERQRMRIIRDRSLRSSEGGFDFTMDIAPWDDDERVEYDYDVDGIPGGPASEVLPGTPFAKWTLGLDYSLFDGNLFLTAMWVHGLVDEFGAGDWITEGWALRKGSAAGNDDATLLECSTPLASISAGDPPRGAQCVTEILRPRIGDFLVFGFDIRFLQQQGLIRVFTLWELNGYTEERWDSGKQRRVRKYHSMFTEEGFSAVLLPELQYNFGYGFELHVGALVQLGKSYTKFGDPAAGGSQVYMRGRFSF